MWPTQIEKSWCSERCVWLLGVYPKSLCPRKKGWEKSGSFKSIPALFGLGIWYISIYLVLCRELSFPHAPGCILVTTGDQFFLVKTQISVLSLLADSWWFHWLVEPELWESQKITKLHTIQQPVCRFSIEHYTNKKVTKMEICKWASVFCSGSTKKGGHILCCSPWL